MYVLLVADRYLMMERLFDASVLVVMWISIYCSSVLFGILLSSALGTFGTKLSDKSKMKYTNGDN